MHGYDIVFTIVAFVVALGVLIVFHEFGHYLVARWCGVKVLRFSIGFGQPLLRKRWGKDQTEWVVAAFPLGGYVKMLDEREGQVAPQDLTRAFNRKPVGTSVCNCRGRTYRQFSAGNSALLVPVHARRQRYETRSGAGDTGDSRCSSRVSKREKPS